MNQPLAAPEGTRFTLGDLEYAVGPKCEDANAPGSWVCTTHSEGFPNNMSMHSHADDGRKHVMAWMCSAHGPETP